MLMKVRMENKFKGKGVRKCRFCGTSARADKGALPVRVQALPARDGAQALASRNMADMMVDRLADAINTIKTHELIGRPECTVYSTKLVRAVLDAMQKEGYITSYEEFTVRHARMLKVALVEEDKRHRGHKAEVRASKDDIQRYEARYMPSKDFGILVVSTPKGVLTSREVKATGDRGQAARLCLLNDSHDSRGAGRREGRSAGQRGHGEAAASAPTSARSTTCCSRSRMKDGKIEVTTIENAALAEKANKAVNAFAKEIRNDIAGRRRALREAHGR